jgi:hypothetical protein
LLPPPPDPFPHQASLCHRWPKLCSSAFPKPSCPLIHQWKTHPWASTTCITDLGLLLSLGKPDGPVSHSRLFDFPTLEPYCPAGGRHSHNGRLLCNSLHSQNPPRVLTISGGSASAMEPTIRTSPPKMDKVGTSSMKIPMVWALVTQLGSEAPNDSPIDDDPDLLN